MSLRSRWASPRLSLDGFYRGVQVLYCLDCGVFHFTHPLLDGEQSFRRADDAFDAVDILLDRGVSDYVAVVSGKAPGRPRRSRAGRPVH